MSAGPGKSASTQVAGAIDEAAFVPGAGTVDDVPVSERIVARVLERPWPVAVWVAVVSWSAVLFAEARADYLGFRFGRFDLGNMVQAVWSTAQGRPLETTLGTGEQAVRFAAHVDPILALFAPFWLLWPSPLLLAGAQIAACALGALPVFWLGRRHLDSEKAAGLLALAYLAYPWLAWTALDAMHPVTLAIPLFLFAIWFLDSGRLWAFAACAVLILVTGELMGLPLAALGLWYGLVRGHRRAGTVIAAAGFLWSVLAVKVIVPHFYGDDSLYYGFYANVGGSPEGVIRTLFTDPGTIASALFSGRDLAYLVLLSAPFAGLFLLAPGLAAVALPQLLANVLSGSPAMSGPQQHYIAAVIPFLIAATVLGLARLPRSRRVFGALVVLMLSVLVTAHAGPWPGTPAAVEIWYQEPVPPDHVDALRDAVALVPHDAPVSATNRAGSHLSARRYVYRIPILGRAEWILLDTRDPHPGDLVSALELERRLRSDSWRRMFSRDGVFVFRKVPSP
jgi:uncharacterized membrane protein